MNKQAETPPLLIAAEVQPAMLAAIVNSSDDAIISKTLQGIITSWNAAAERMFGYTREEAVGKHISLIIPPSRMQEEKFIIGRVKSGKKVDHFETIRIAKSGLEVAISLSVSPVIDSTGKIIGASKIARDISARLEAQETAARLYEQVRELNQKKDEFIGLASHELKTPLTTISGYLQILSRVNNDEHCRKYIDKSRQQVQKLTDLVNGLLDVSRIEAGRLQLNIEKFDLLETIKDRIELTKLSASKRHIIVETTIKKCEVEADEPRIVQVLDNLLTNAVKYSPGTGTITVILQSSKTEVSVGICDNGLGIAADKLAHIFTRFYRIDEATPNISGLGIGLYLSHEIISRHSGKLWVESELGKGSTFWFTLPLIAK